MAKRISGCRVCVGPHLTTLLDFGRIAPCGVFPATRDDDPDSEPLEVVRCDDCGLVQLAHDLDPRVTFTPEGFGYRSGTNPSMKAHLRSLAERLTAMAHLHNDSMVVDIGSNDGTFLSYLPSGVAKVGVDPVALRYDRNYPPETVIYPQFWDEEVSRQCRRAKLITCFATLYDLPDPNAFMMNVANALGPAGVFACEVAFYPLIKMGGGWDVISHEHLEYYDASVLQRLMGNAGLKIDYMEVNPINGGSVFFTARRNPGQRIVVPPWENGGNLRTIVDRTLDKCGLFFEEAKDQGWNVHGYAASTRGNTLLQVLQKEGELEDEIVAVADANPDKWGRYTPGTLIPIISEEESRAADPDYYFVLSSHFIDSFIERERDFLERGGQFVLPFPTFRIIGKHDIGTL